MLTTVPRPPMVRDDRGTTLVELLIGVAIVGVLLAGIIPLWQKAQLSYLQSSVTAQLQGDLRAAVDQLSHDIRKAGRNVTGTASVHATCTPDVTKQYLFPVSEATALTLRLRMDLTDDGTCDDAEEDVRYVLDTGARTLARNGVVLARNIQAPGNVPFTYAWRPTVGVNCTLDPFQTGSAPSEPQRGCIRRVTVALETQTTTLGDSLTRAVSMDIDLRSR